MSKQQLKTKNTVKALHLCLYFASVSFTQSLPLPWKPGRKVLTVNVFTIFIIFMMAIKQLLNPNPLIMINQATFYLGFFNYLYLLPPTQVFPLFKQKLMSMFHRWAEMLTLPLPTVCQCCIKSFFSALHHYS